MKKNNKKTFSQRAQDLVKKYSRSNFDKVEKQELDAALQKLQEEQELYKQVNKIGEYSDEAMAQKAMEQQQMLSQQQAQQSQMQSHGQFPHGSPQGQPMQMDSQVGQIARQQQEPRQFWDGGGFGPGSDYDTNWRNSTLDKGYTDFIRQNAINGIQDKNNFMSYNNMDMYLRQGENIPSVPFTSKQLFSKENIDKGQLEAYKNKLTYAGWKANADLAHSMIPGTMVGYRSPKNNNSSLGVLQSQGENVPAYQAPTYNGGLNFNKPVETTPYTIAGKQYALKNTPANTPSTQQSAVNQDQQIGQTQSILPSVIAGGIGMLGNIALGKTVKEHKFNQSYGADQISLAKERERLSREATTARNIGIRNLSGAGSRGAYLAGAGNVSAAVNQQLGDALSQSYFKEGMTNLKQRQKADELNRQVAIMNYQAKINADNERRGYYSAAAQIPSQTMQDIGRINYQNAALLSSGTDNYIAGTNGKSSPWKSQQIMRKFKK